MNIYIWRRWAPSWALPESPSESPDQVLRLRLVALYGRTHCTVPTFSEALRPVAWYGPCLMFGTLPGAAGIPRSIAYHTISGSTLHVIVIKKQSMMMMMIAWAGIGVASR